MTSHINLGLDTLPTTANDLFCDGGLIGRNPSEIGGTWAFCYVHGGQIIAGASGIVTPKELEIATVTNNVTELLAAVICLENWPYASGRLYTDSNCTKMRLEYPFRNQTKMNGVPDSLVQRLRSVRSRVHTLSVVLLAGHPTREELKRGYDAENRPVSAFNKWCDSEATRRSDEFTKRGLVVPRPVLGAACQAIS